MKMIIAPHEVSEERIKELTEKLSCKYALYNEELGVRNEELKKVDVLVINTIGVLSSVYQYVVAIRVPSFQPIMSMVLGWGRLVSVVLNTTSQGRGATVFWITRSVP